LELLTFGVPDVEILEVMTKFKIPNATMTRKSSQATAAARPKLS
jgi:hypothetical protein